MSFLSLDKEGKLLVKKNNQWMTQEEAFKIIPTTKKEECDATRKKFEQESSGKKR